MAGLNLPQTINPSSITQNPGTAAGGLLGPPSWNVPGGSLSSYTPGQPFSISQNVGDPSLTQGYGNYAMDPNTGQYSLGNTVQPQGSDANSFLDQLIRGGSQLGLAAAGGLAGASALGTTGGATSLFGGSNPLFGTAATTGGASPLTYGSVPGSFGGPGGAPIAGDVGAGMGGALPGAAGSLPAASTPGLAGLDTSLFGPAGTTSGISGPLSGIGGGPLDALNTGVGGASGLGGGALNGFNAGGSVSGLTSNPGNFLSNLFTPGGQNSLLNTNSIGSLLSSLLGSNRSGQLAGNLTGPYGTAMGNAQPAVNNLLSMMNPNNFYNSQVGQNLMASKVRDINATQSAGGRFGIGPGGSIPSSGQGIDAANLLNQYMAQQYSSALTANSGATGQLLGAVNATYPGYNAGNVIGANSANPLMSLFNNPAFSNAGNSALQYLWNGLG